MNKFDECIENSIKRNKYRPVGMEEGVHTIGEFISAVFQVENEQDAKEFYEGYLKYLRKQPDLVEDLEHVARRNIGWCFGEGMSREKIAMWLRVCDASHPVFGTCIPSLSKAFEAGKKFTGKEASNIGTMELKLSLVDLAVKVDRVLIRRAQLLKAAGIVGKGWKSPV